MGVLSNDHQLASGHQYFDNNVQVEGTLLGRKKEVYTPATGETIPANKSGAVIVLSNNIAVKLPAPAAGLNYKFVNNADDGTANTITSTVDGTRAANLLSGIIQDGNSIQRAQDDDVITFTGTKHEGDYIDITCVGAGSSAVAATMTMYIGAGNAVNEYAEKDKLTLISTDGTSKSYCITDTSNGGVATGTILVDADNTDTGTGTAGASEDGCIAVGVIPGTTKQGAVLNALKDAVEHANGHNGKITMGADVESTAGAKTMVFTQAEAGLGGNTVVTIDTGFSMFDTVEDFTEGSTASGGGDFQWHYNGVSSDNSGLSAG
tara:strand:+ start:96 stop:1055 length:960 start_codon:yes stop_codon:yes gene_type:complete